MRELFLYNQAVFVPLQLTRSCPGQPRHPGWCLRMGLWDATAPFLLLRQDLGRFLCSRAAPGTQPPQMVLQVRLEGGTTAPFLGFLQSTAVPSCSFLIVVSRTGKVLLQKLQLLMVCVIHLLIIYENIITEQLSKQSPPSSTPSPPNKPT